MKRLEVIHLRSSGAPIESLGDRIRESVQSAGDNCDFVTLYRRDGLDTDVAVHIHYPKESNTSGTTSLGVRLASELRAFGLVEHALWEELK